MRFGFCTILLLLGSHLCASPHDPLFFERIPGLSQNTVYALTQDRQGFVWIATADGLNRFDGIETRIFKPSLGSQPGHYNNRMIRSPLLEDASSRIWFSSNAGLYSYNKKKDAFEHRRLDLTGQGRSWQMDPLYSDGDIVWGSNSAVGMIEYNAQGNTWKAYPVGGQLPGRMIFRYCIKDSRNNFWALAERGVYFFNRQTRVWMLFFQQQSFTSLFAGADCIYLGLRGRLFQSALDGVRLEPIHVQGHSSYMFRAAHTDRSGNTWLGDDQGNLLYRERGSHVFEWRGNINPSTSLTRYPVYSICADTTGILWVGADVLGLLKAKTTPPAFTVFPPMPGAGGSNPLFIHSLCEDGEQVWLGTYKQGLLRLNKRTRSAVAVGLGSQKDEHSIRIVKFDSKGNLWVCGYQRLYLRKNGENRFLPIELPRPESVLTEPFPHPLALLEHNDTLYCSTFWGIYRISEFGKRIEHYDEAAAGFVYDLYLDGRGNYWLATENGIYRQSALSRRFDPEQGDSLLFQNFGVKSFQPDRERKMLWISTTSGLIAFHEPSGAYRLFTEDDGLCNSHIYGVIVDGDRLWISTNRGMSRASVQYNPGQSFPRITFTNFSSEDGLPDDEFNTGAFHRGESGDLFFGTIKGAVWFSPEALTPNKNLPAIVMTQVLVNESRADSLLAPEFIQHLELPYHRNNLYFAFRGIDHHMAGQVQYSYRLVGWDQDWIQSGTLSQVRYSNLPHGHYVFQVRAANGSGLWNEQPYQLTVIIHPPFWKTTWFYVLVGLLATILVLATTRFAYQLKLKRRIRELEKEKALEAERLRISREMHDDIGAGLTRITLMSELAKKDRPGEKMLDEIAETSRQLVSNMSEIIWSLNAEERTLDQFLGYLREQLLHLLEPCGITHRISFPEVPEEIRLSADQQRNLLLVAKELVNNSIKYSQAACIQVNGLLVNGDLRFSVTDDGVGFDPGRLYPGNGLKNVRYRLGQIGAHYCMGSSNGSGAKVEFTLPLKSHSTNQSGK